MIFYKGNFIVSLIVLLNIFLIFLIEKKEIVWGLKKICVIMGDMDDNFRDRSLLRELDDLLLLKFGVILYMVRVLKNWRKCFREM